MRSFVPMGRRGATETLAKVLGLLLEKRGFVQSEAAKAVGVRVEALRRCLEDLREAGLPLVATREANIVRWSVPSGWLPGAVVFDEHEADALLRVLLRAPASKKRDELVRKLLAGSRRGAAPRTLEGGGGDEGSLDASSERVLEQLEDAAREQRAVRVRYAAASSPSDEARWRTVSVQLLRMSERHARCCNARGGDHAS